MPSLPMGEAVLRVRIMETLLLKMLAVQNQILASHQELLAEVRLLRRAVEQGGLASLPMSAAPVEPIAAEPASTMPEPTAAAPIDAPGAPVAPAAAPIEAEPIAPPPVDRPVSRGRGMLTVDELTDLGGQFLDPESRPKGKVKTIDAADLSSSLLDEIKAKNRAKRDAFAEFDRLRRDR